MTTKELFNKITSASSWEELKAILPKKVSFGKKFVLLVDEKNSTINRVSEDTGISDSLLYAVGNDKRKLSRENVIRVGFSLHLTMEELNELLKIGGHKELYPRNKEDSIIIWGMENNKSRWDVDSLLEEVGSDFFLGGTKKEGK